MTQRDAHPLNAHQTIRERLKTLRKRRGWTAAQLAEEMSKNGIPWNRAIVANIEHGRRSYVTVEEALLLAYLLEVAPIHLIIDPSKKDLLPLGSRELIDPPLLRAWFRGQSVVGEVDQRQYFSEVPESEFEPPQIRWIKDGEDAD